MIKKSEMKVKFVCAWLLLLFLIFSFAAIAQEDITLKGTLEVLHADDFDNPENSRFIFYININGQRYELKTDKELPVMKSGIPIRVTGDISNSSILVKSLVLTDSGQEIIKDEAAASIADVAEPEKNPNTYWILALGGILILIILFAFLIKNKSNRRIRPQS